MGRRLILTLVSLAACVLALQAYMPPSAIGDSSVIADCNAHGKLTQQYTIGQLRTALSTMPADVKEYTNCYDLAEHALLAEASAAHQTGHLSGSGSGGSFLPTPVIVIVVLLALAGIASAAVVARRRGQSQDNP